MPDAIDVLIIHHNPRSLIKNFIRREMQRAQASVAPFRKTFQIIKTYTYMISEFRLTRRIFTQSPDFKLVLQLLFLPLAHLCQFLEIIEAINSLIKLKLILEGILKNAVLLLHFS